MTLREAQQQQDAAEHNERSHAIAYSLQVTLDKLGEMQEAILCLTGCH